MKLIRMVCICAVLILIQGSPVSAAEPISIGFALSDGVAVYADTVAGAAVIDTLAFADYRLALGVQGTSGAVFDQNGWTRVEQPDGSVGWVRYTVLALTRYIVVYPASGDSIFAEPSISSEFRNVYQDFRQIVTITSREFRDRRLWLGREGQNGWLLVKRFDIEWEDAYAKLVETFSHLNGSNPDYFLNLKPETDYAQALAIAERLEQALTPGDTLVLEADAFVDKSQVVVGAGAYAAWLKSRLYLASGDTALSIQALERIVRDFGSQPLFIGRAGAEASLWLADPPYSNTLLDSAKTEAVLRRMIRDYPDEPVEGFEWNDWVDERAARRLLERAGNDATRLANEAHQLLKEARSDVVRLVAQQARVRSMGLQGNLDAMADTAFALLETLPDRRRGFYMAGIHYRYEIVATVVSFMNREEERCRVFLERIAARFSDELLGMLARLRLSQLDEEGDASMAELKRTYDGLLDYPERFRVWDTTTQSYISYDQAFARMDTLIWDVGKVTAVIAGPTLLRKYKRPDAPVKSLVPAGTVVRILYPYRQTRIVSHLAHPVKIELENGSAGWVDSHQIKLKTDE